MSIVCPDHPTATAPFWVKTHRWKTPALQRHLVQLTPLQTLWFSKSNKHNASQTSLRLLLCNYQLDLQPKQQNRSLA